MIRIIVVDDQRIMRDGLATLLSLEDGIEVMAKATNGREAYELAAELRPDVVLMDIRMPGVDGVEGTRMIRSSLPEIKVLILTTFQDSELIMAALEEGAHGYLLKDMPSEAIASAIRTVHQGGTVLQPGVTNQIVQELRKVKPGHASTAAESTLDKRTQLLSELTEREMEVLALLGEGLNNKEISERLYITEGTVKNHVSNLIAKLDFRDRTQAAVFAVRHGLSGDGS